MSSGKSELAFQVHDLRNKISAALSFVELLEYEEPSASQNTLFASVRECLDSAIEASSELSLAVSPEPASDDAQPSSPMIVTSAVHMLTEAAPEAFAALARQFPIKVEYACTLLDEDRMLSTNPHAITSIRQNVIANAVNSGATVLRVHYQMKDYGLQITLEDNGCGMSEDDLNRLKLRQIGDGRIHGLGTQRIVQSVEAHNAVVTYFSEEGKGTQVQILCPYMEVEAVGDNSAEDTASPPGSLSA